MTKEVYDIIKRKKGRGGTSETEGRYEQKRRERVMCRLCGKEMSRASLARHMEGQHGVVEKKYRARKMRTSSEKAEYKIKIIKGQFNEYPVRGCTGGGKDKFGICRHFCLRHPEAKLEIEGEGELQRCLKCGMFVQNMTTHLNSYTCKKGRKRRENEFRQDEQARAEEVDFFVNGNQIERVKHFNYLGRILSDRDDDTKCIEGQISKARGRWGSVAKILKQEGANSVCMGKFYLAIVQALLLYGSESRVISAKNLKKLESFHKRAVRHMTGQHIRKKGED